ncbi:Dual specificity protein phosphatase 14 [Halocaridina rubra]|uniref:Dual specificity protein phosphatase 14 n=1 Tax=Halocaridina rubra TaxID=373956 RepID=A0AAN8ZT18_HALRR
MPENLKSSVVKLPQQLEREKSVKIVNHWPCRVDSGREANSHCRLVSASQVSLITDWLFLSGAKAIRQKRLRELGITCLVNCTVELPTVPLDGVESVKIDVCDSPNVDLKLHFDSISDKIEDVRLRGGKVLVHCVAGVSRSPALILAYLVKYGNMNLRQAYFYVKNVRSNIRPNVGFFSQLIDYERRVRGSTTVILIHEASLGLTIPDVCEDELIILRDKQWARLISDRRNFQRVYA